MIFSLAAIFLCGLAPVVHGGCCTTDASCLAQITQTQQDYLNDWNKSLTCDTECTTPNPDLPPECNFFGVCFDCKACFLTQADGEYYFSVFPPATPFDICPNAPPTPAPKSASNDATEAPTTCPTYINPRPEEVCFNDNGKTKTIVELSNRIDDIIMQIGSQPCNDSDAESTQLAYLSPPVTFTPSEGNVTNIGALIIRLPITCDSQKRLEQLELLATRFNQSIGLCFEDRTDVCETAEKTCEYAYECAGFTNPADHLYSKIPSTVYQIIDKQVEAGSTGTSFLSCPRYNTETGGVEAGYLYNIGLPPNYFTGALNSSLETHEIVIWYKVGSCAAGKPITLTTSGVINLDLCPENGTLGNRKLVSQDPLAIVGSTAAGGFFDRLHIVL